MTTLVFLPAPPPIVQVSVPISAEHQPRLSSIQSGMEALAAQGASDTPQAQRLINEYRMATGEAKVEGVIDFLRGLPALQAAAAAARPAAAAAAAAAGGGDGGESDGGGGGSGGVSGGRIGQQGGKVLVFAHHQGVLDAVQQRLCEAEGLTYVRIDGRSSPFERQVGQQDDQGGVWGGVDIGSASVQGMGI